MRSIILLKLLRIRKDIGLILIMTLLCLMTIYMITSASNTVFKHTVAIVQEEENPSYDKFVSLLKESRSFDFEEMDLRDATNQVEEGGILAGLVIRKDKVSILKVVDDTNIFVLESLVSSTMMNMQTNQNIAVEITDYISDIKDIDKEETREEIYRELESQFKYRKPIKVSKSILDKDNENGYDYILHGAIGMILFFSMYTMVFGIGSILEDKRFNTWNRILVSPISKKSILGGNFIVTFIMGSFQILLLIVLSKYIFNIDWGTSLLGISIIALAFVFTTTSLGLMLSGIVDSPSQLSAISPIILTSTSMLGGAMWPLEIVESKIILFLANFTPQKWAIEGMANIAIYGTGLGDMALNLAVLTGLGLVFFIIGVRLVK